ncbi:MAG: hypothetical protein WAT09_05420 [Paracoccaceae bacterium]
MFGQTFQTRTDTRRILTEEFDGGRRFVQRRDIGFTFGKLFGVVFSLFWIGSGLAMPFLSEATVPGMSLLLKAAIGIFLVLFGAFILSAIWRQLGGVLEIDLAKGCLRHFTIDRNNKQHGFREIAFQDVRGVFTEGEPVDDNTVGQKDSLIIAYHGRPGRLVALSAPGDQIATVRDFILTEALHRPAAPHVDGLVSFAQRAKWECLQRMN